MTDREKLQYLIGYLEGIIGNSLFFTSVDVNALKKVIARIESDEII